MTKVLVVLYKRPAMTWDAFRHYWRDDHGPLAAQIPGLRRYVHNDTPEAGNPPYGFAELYFDSPWAMRAGLATPAGQAALGDLANFADPDKTGMIVVDEAGIIEILSR